MRYVLVVLLFLSALCPGIGQPSKPILAQKPSISATLICFSYAGDLWTVSRNGGTATRLTSGAGTETDPRFSPDGTLVAFTGEYDGNVDVYVVEATGGVPKRLTYHPWPDQVVGWTPDGKRVLFSSPRNSYSGFYRLFTVPVAGGMPDPLPLPMAFEGCYSPDGTRIAYVPFGPQQAWKRYRGGSAMPIWVANLSDSSIEKVPRDSSVDHDPMWVGNTIYFLSDRDGPTTIYAYDMASRRVARVLPNDGLELKSASVGPGAIVYEQFGSVGILNLETRKARDVEIQIAADLLEVRPKLVKVADKISNASISPTGKRVVFEARGDLFSVPAEKGDARSLTSTSGVAERDPAWSPDGRWIAYFSDESGEYELHLRETTINGQVRKIRLPAPQSFYYSPLWSPDSKKLAFMDKHRALWYIDVEKERLRKIDADTYDIPSDLSPSWSPDSRWVAYTKMLPNRMGTVFVYSIESAKSYQITDGMSDARSACFDRSGRHLFFTASTDSGPASAWLDLSSRYRPRTSSVYVVVLRKDDPSPLAPESDEEKAEEPKKPSGEGARNSDAKPGEAKPAGGESKGAGPAEGAKEEAGYTRIDLDGIRQRILDLPIPARRYTNIVAGKPGTIFVVEEAQPYVSASDGRTVSKFDLAKRKFEKVADGLLFCQVSANGEKLLYRTGQGWGITSADNPKAGEGLLKLDGMEARVNPREEWRQMYAEEWRIQRDYFYDPNLHGLDVRAAQERYAPYLEAVASRADLNYLFAEMLGEITCGHIYVFGGDTPNAKRVPVGLLGADYAIENGRYRFAKVYDGENWNPGTRAPLTQPGVNVKAGEYLLAVNGRDVTTDEEVYSYFEATAGRQTVLRVGPNPDGSGSREVTVVPIDSEFGLRNLAWIEGNRRKVNELSGGKLAYVYMPNTSTSGYASFNRYYFAQVDKEGVVIDERFNGGGQIADYIVDCLRRPLMCLWAPREGAQFGTPIAAIYGPKAMIINEMAGSGGDAMPWLFRKAGLGKLVGKRTWGGLVGMTGNPTLIDGGYVTVPTFGFHNLDGQWEIENHGVDPDIEVEFDPKAWRDGRDPQLEKAVEILMAELKAHPRPTYKRPPYPNYHPAGTPLARASSR